MSTVITGAGGFLGWHTRALLHSGGETDTRPIPLGAAFSLADATHAVNGVQRAIHIAGVNRGSDEEVRRGNVNMAEQFAQALERAVDPPKVVVFANSSQVGNGSAYAEGKERAAEVLAESATRIGARFDDLRLPNLFGEHGLPRYNSVTATFCHLLAIGERPKVDQDRELTLLHAQDAAGLLTGEYDVQELPRLQHRRTVSDLLAALTGFAESYSTGDVPELATTFDRDLFNTYRSFSFAERPEIRLTQNTDARGSFTEVIRAHGGSGQTSFSTTVPGVTRGQHFHRRKIERFAVLAGMAEISLRRILTNDVVTFTVSGEAPTAIDMPTMWAHNITNVGTEPLYTLFWSNEIFDPANPDTFAEPV